MAKVMTAKEMTAKYGYEESFWEAFLQKFTGPLLQLFLQMLDEWFKQPKALREGKVKHQDCDEEVKALALENCKNACAACCSAHALTCMLGCHDHE